MKTILTITLEVSTSNINIQSLNNDYGFSEIRGYSPNVREDWDELEDLDLSKFRDVVWEKFTKPEEVPEDNVSTEKFE